MDRHQGVGVSPGIAIGRAKVVDNTPRQVDHKPIAAHEIDGELERLSQAIEHIEKDITQLVDSYSFGQDEREILDTHRLIVQDPDLIASIEQIVRDELICLEGAIAKYFQQAAQLFAAMDDEYMSQRISDYREVGQRLLRRLQGNELDIELDDEGDAILVIDEIPIALIMKLSRVRLAGIATEKGSRTSHAAIIARSMGLPVVVGLRNISSKVKDGDTCVVDANSGLFITNPDKHTLTVYEQLYHGEMQHQEELVKLTDQPTATSDGERIYLRLNIEMPDELENVMQFGMDGVGLFRTEFLFLDRETLPSEDEQYEIYRKAAERLNPAPLVIRTIDLGGDKLSNLLNLSREANPALGCRGIRLSLQHPEIFRTQIKAILRASTVGAVRIMLPLITTVAQVKRTREIVRNCEKELAQQGMEYRRNVPLGVMIETPAAAMISQSLADECDFFSIGTNDLIQYTLAVDRASDAVADDFDPYHPAVLHLITLTVQNARKRNLPVSVCGEMAAESDFIPFLIGLGLKELSVSPGMYLLTKERIMRTSSSDVIDLVLDLLDASCADDIRRRIANWRRKHRV